MSLSKSETNNAIVVELQNVRKHPNADRMLLATVLGTQVIVGLEAKDGDIQVYFDSNLRLNHEYLHYGNLYSNPAQNFNPDKKGYFPKTGRVKAQKLRGEISNGLVVGIESLTNIPGVKLEDLRHLEGIESIGREFDTINGIMICEKFIVNTKTPGQGDKQKTKHKLVSDVFYRHWDTKQLMRDIRRVVPIGRGYIEEKIHGTSGRTARVECFADRSGHTAGLFKGAYKLLKKMLPRRARKWFGQKMTYLASCDFISWVPGLKKVDWRVVSGTRRVDNVAGHMTQVRETIDAKIAPHLKKGEQVYYEIYGYDSNGGLIQSTGGHAFKYDCRPGEYRAMLYRVTITTPDGFAVDLPRHMVYKRAGELGLEKPHLLATIDLDFCADADAIARCVQGNEAGVSMLDAATMREGCVLWFMDETSVTGWNCLKLKSEEFLLLESIARDNEQGDVEDEL